MVPALFRLAIVLPLLAGIAVAGASGTLYESLGAKAGVAAISDALIDRVASDPVFGRSFADTN